MKIVIDTNLVASAIFFGGMPHKLVRLLMDGRFNAYTTESIIEEQECGNRDGSRFPVRQFPG